MTIKVADRAGGLPRSMVPKVWSFAHSDNSDSVRDDEDGSQFGIDEVSLSVYCDRVFPSHTLFHLLLRTVEASLTFCPPYTF